MEEVQNLHYVSAAARSAALRPAMENPVGWQTVKPRAWSGYWETLGKENSAIHLRDTPGADLGAGAFAIGVGVDGNDLQGYQKDASTVHRPVLGVSAVVPLSSGDVLGSDRSSVAHGDILEAGANAGDLVKLNLGCGSSAVAGGMSVSEAELALGHLEEDALGIETFCLDPTSVAMAGPPDPCEQYQSQL